MANLETALLHQVAPPCLVLPPVTPTGTATTYSAYVNTADYGNGVCFVINVNNDSTGSAIAISVVQATAAAGTGVKAVPLSSQWSCITLDPTLPTNGLLTGPNAVTSNTFNTFTTASKAGTYIVEVPISSLDVNNGFLYVAIKTISAGTGHQAIVINAIPYPPRFAQDVQIVNPLA